MNDKIIHKAQDLIERNRRCKMFMNNLKMSDISYSDRPVYFKTKETSLDVPIPDELRQPISDMLYSYYRRLSNDLQREFDILETRQGECEPEIKCCDENE